MGIQSKSIDPHQALTVRELEAMVRELEAKEEALEAKIVHMLAVFPPPDEVTAEMVKNSPSAL